MGCQVCTRIDANENLLQRIMDYIERDDTYALDHMIKLLAFEDKKQVTSIINSRLIQSKNTYLSFLAYAVLLGRSKVYQFLIQKLNASVTAVEEIFVEEGQSVINFICKKGYLELLKAYLPRYLSNYYSEEKLMYDKNSTLSFSTYNLTHTNSHSTYTPIQIACNYGYIAMIMYLNDYFTNQALPNQFDVHYIDETTGENCALIATRTGNFIMMKVLFEKLRANFHLKNKNNEGALQIIAAATKNYTALYFLECIMYLIEVVQIDITYMYEETLLLLENRIIISYIEDKLRSLGINTSKREIDDRYRIRSYLNMNTITSHINVDIKGDSNEISAIEADPLDTFFGASPDLKVQLDLN